MKNEFPVDENKEQIEKAKMNLVYVGIASIVMLFAGLTSAYIVSMGDSFWLKFPLPSFFMISTGVIIASSLFIQLAVYFARSGNKTGLKAAISITFILGLAFTYFQFKGYGQLVDNGVHFTGNFIVVTEGKYGDYYDVKYKGDFIEVDGNDYLIKGKKMTPLQMEEYQKFMSQFLVMNDKKPFEVNQYGKDFVLYYHNTPLEAKDGILLGPDNEELSYLDKGRLTKLAENVKLMRGDFFVKGEIGKDFHVYVTINDKREELQYENRVLKVNGKELPHWLQHKLMGSADTSSSYLFFITFLHLLHIIVTLFYMLKLVIRSFSGKINSENNLSIRTGAIFWHFLGLLWLYLLLFLLFIH